MSAIPEISAVAVRGELLARREIALLDLREEALFAQGHPLFAAQLSIGRLETEVLDRIPRKDTCIVLYDDGDGLVTRGAEAFRSLGYSDVRALAGGLEGWRSEGFELFQDVNSYCKAFGELVEHHRGTPSLPAETVLGLLESGSDVIVLDARPFEEFNVMSIPTATNVPGGELVLRAQDLAPNPKTLIIVNCAGRTRSLIGAQSLINAGVLNPVAALRNGTIGWLLAGQSLEQGQTRSPAATSAADRAGAEARAREVADRAGARHVDGAALEALAADEPRTLYRFDVRPAAEYEAGHIPGFRHAPGGQLVQETDVFAPVRGARIVLYDDIAVRADMTASWLSQMGWETCVLDPAKPRETELGPWAPRRPAPPPTPQVTPAQLAAQMAEQTVSVVDFAGSRAHGRAHIPGAWFALRSRLADGLGSLSLDRSLVLTSDDGFAAAYAFAEVEALCGGAASIAVLRGGTAAWGAAGLPVESGFFRTAHDPLDRYRRPYEGVDNGDEAMQAYLDWEFGLVEQLRRDGTHGFFVI